MRVLKPYATLCASAAFVAALLAGASNVRGDTTSWSQVVADHFLGPYVMLIPTGRVGQLSLVVAPNDGIYPTRLPLQSDPETALFNVDVSTSGNVVKATRLIKRQFDLSESSHDMVAEELKSWHFKPFVKNGVPIAITLKRVPVTLVKAPHLAGQAIQYPALAPTDDASVRLSRFEALTGSNNNYTIDVNRSGATTYSGKGNTVVTGAHSNRISAAHAEGLIRNLTTADPLRVYQRSRRTLHSSCDDTVIITIRGKDILLAKQESISRFDGFMPNTPDLMIDLVFRAANAAQWVHGKFQSNSQAQATRLETATELGDEILVRELVGQRVHTSPATLVAAAGRMGNPDLARLLISSGASGDDAMELAAHRADYEAINTLLSIRQAWPTPVLTNAMLTVTAYGALDPVKALLRAGADPKGITKWGDTFLMVAAGTGDPSLVSLALEQDIGPNEKSKSTGHTALHKAMGHGLRRHAVNRVKTVQLLLKAGADPNVSDSNGVSPLMSAVWSERMVAVLLAAGANVNARNQNGSTALTFGCPTPSVARALVAGGARIHEQSELGRLYHQCWFDPKTRESAKDLIELLGRQLK